MVHSAPEGAATGLRREVRPRQYFTLAFGAIIGVGWVVVLGEWLVLAGPVGAILGFVLGIALMTLVGVCYAEVTTMLPTAGGEVAFAYEIFGVRTSFAVGWLLVLAYGAVGPFEAISIGWVVGALLPGLEGPVAYRILGGEVETGTLALGLAATALLTWVNLRGARSVARLQDAATWTLVALTAVFVLAGILGGSVDNLRPFFGEEGAGRGGLLGILAVFMTAPFWFGGFDSIPQMMEERAEDASLRSVGRMIVASILAAGLFYCLVIFAASMARPWPELVDADLPAATAFRGALGWAGFGDLVLVAALLGLLSTWNSTFVITSRLVFALGRARLAPAFLGRLDPDRGVPRNAVLFVGITTALGSFLGREAILPLVNLVGTCLALAFLVTCVGMIRLRITDPDRERPYRAPGGVATAGVAVAGSALVFGISLYQPVVGSEGRIPLEWIMFFTWSVLGVLFWLLSWGSREAMSEAERRRIFLSGVPDSPSEGRS